MTGPCLVSFHELVVFFTGRKTQSDAVRRTGGVNVLTTMSNENRSRASGDATVAALFRGWFDYSEIEPDNRLSEPWFAGPFLCVYLVVAAEGSGGGPAMIG